MSYIPDGPLEGKVFLSTFSFTNPSCDLFFVGVKARPSNNNALTLFVCV